MMVAPTSRTAMAKKRMSFHAFKENGVTTTTSSSTTDIHDITDICVVKGADSEIEEVMATEGHITDYRIQGIIQKYSSVVAMVRKHFPRAMGSSQILRRVSRVLKGFGITAENTLYAQSVCPDEINHEVGDITNLFTDYLGEVFHLGGLAGVPFTGKTGFAAFSHHVPDGGHAFILQAPHIGITMGGKFGMYSRVGQSASGAACGAAVGAFKHCCNPRNALPSLTDEPEDYQMCFLIHEVKKRMENILNEDYNAEQASLAMETYQIGNNLLDKIVSTDFGDKSSKLIIFTGIQINMPGHFEDYFEPLSFQIRYKNGKIHDLFEGVFGDGTDPETECWS